MGDAVAGLDAEFVPQQSREAPDAVFELGVGHVACIEMDGNAVRRPIGVLRDPARDVHSP